MASRILELKRQYGEEQARILNEVATLGERSRQVGVSLTTGAREQLGDANYTQLRAAARAAWVSERRDEMKTKYIELDLERVAAIDEALRVAEQELAPRDVTTESVLMATRMSEQELINSMDTAAGLGEAGVETIKLCLSVARQKEDYDMAIAHALKHLPELEDAYADVLLAAEEPELNDPGDKFEMLADRAPTKQDILGAPQSDINAYGQMR